VPPAPDSRDPVRAFYRDFHDAIQDKRLESPYPLRRYVHRALMSATLEMVRSCARSGDRILDAGCGEGALVLALSTELADRNVTVTGVDISTPNVATGLARLRDSNGAPGTEILVADLESLPFADGSFDVVVSSHVLEHLPHFERGLAELRRVSRDVLVLGLPTCLNPCAMAILGGDSYWTISRRTPYAFFLGLGRVVGNLRGEGVDEGYVGRKDLPHLWRYPWVMRSAVEKAGFDIVRFEAPTLAIPYLPGLLPGGLRLQRNLDRLRRARGWRNLGYGSLLLARKR
jgi:ubiquinone/menaquinone biosynthesis C-methylase UbiE